MRTKKCENHEDHDVCSQIEYKRWLCSLRIWSHDTYRCYNFRLHKIVESVDVKVDDLKTRKFKHQEAILDSESDDDEEETIDTQTKEE